MNLMEMLLDAIKSWHVDPKATAKKLRGVEEKIISISEKLEMQGQENPWMSDGGLGDKVLINVVGPDGSTKQTVTQG